jgi:hypothetical protein
VNETAAALDYGCGHFTKSTTEENKVRNDRSNWRGKGNQTEYASRKELKQVSGPGSERGERIIEKGPFRDGNEVKEIPRAQQNAGWGSARRKRDDLPGTAAK